ncbi:MAG: DUF3137 domain-containing protein [Flammeovirgaceae bacterium]
MKDLDEFEGFFKSSLIPELIKLEDRRHFMKEKGTRVGVISVSVIFIHWALIYVNLVPSYSIILTLLATPGAAYLYYRSNYHDETIPEDFKEITVSKIVEFADPSLSYDPDGFIPFSAFRASQLFMQAPDHYAGDDFIKGQIDGLPMMMSELFVQYESEDKGAKNKDNWETIFKGLFMVVELPKEVIQNIFVFSDELNRSIGYAGRLIQEGNIQYGHYTKPANPVFRDHFVVYSANPIIGERLLTERFMHELLQMKGNAKAPVHLSILGNQLYVAIERQRDFFEIDLKRSLLSWDYISSFYKDLYYVFNIISDLDVTDMLESE